MKIVSIINATSNLRMYVYIAFPKKLEETVKQAVGLLTNCVRVIWWTSCSRIAVPSRARKYTHTSLCGDCSCRQLGLCVREQFQEGWLIFIADIVIFAVYNLFNMATENIFLFVPNIIGYARIVLAIISFYYMANNYVWACWTYVLSALLDALDGHAARYFNQSTKFGAILDQLTDRCGTMCLLVTLSYFYPKYMFYFQLSMCIDIACHWIYLHSTVLQGRSSHKFIDMSANPVMRIYYTSRAVLFFMCAGNEAFYAALYLLHFTEGTTVLGLGIWRIVCYITAPIAFVKTLISLLQGYVACKNMGTIDSKERDMSSTKKN